MLSVLKRTVSMRRFFLSPQEMVSLDQNRCCGCSKELSQLDGSFGNPKHMFRLLGKKIITILRSNILLNWT